MRSILTLFFRLRQVFHRSVFPWNFSNKTADSFFTFPMYTACFTHFILPALSIPIDSLYDEEYDLWNYSLFIYLCPPITACFLQQNVVTSCSHTPSVFVGKTKNNPCTVNILVCMPDQPATQRTFDVMLVASGARRQLYTIYWYIHLWAYFCAFPPKFKLNYSYGNYMLKKIYAD